MMASDRWTDLLDPDEEQLREQVPRDLRRDAWQELLRPADEHGVVPRPTIKSHGSYVLGLLLAPVAVPEEDLVYYQEVDFVLTTRPPGDHPQDAGLTTGVRVDEHRGSLRGAAQRSVAGNDRVLPHR